MADVRFTVVAADFASRKFREIGDAAGLMAAKVVAADAAMDKAVGNSGRRMSLLLQGIITAGGAVPPILGAIALAAGAMSSAIVSALPGVGALGLALKTTFSSFQATEQSLQQAQQKVQSTTPGTAAHHAAVQALHQVQQTAFQGAYGHAFQGYMSTKDMLQNFGNSNGGTIYPIFNKAFSGIQTLLPMLKPIVASFGGVVSAALTQIDNAMKGPGFANFLTWVQQVGAVNFDNIIRTIGNLGAAVVNLAMAFSGQGQTLTQWLLNMSQGIRNWSSTLQNSTGFQHFLTFMRQNGPLLVDTLKNIALTLPHLVAAFTPLSHINLWALDHLSILLKNFPTWAITAIILGLEGLQIAAWVVGGISALVGAMTALKDMCILTRIELFALRAAEIVSAVASGVLSAAMFVLDLAMDANPISLIIIAIIALIAILVACYFKVGWFHNAVVAAFHAVGAAMTWLWHAGVAAAHGIGAAFTWVAHAMAPVASFIIRCMADMMTMWGHLLIALGHVPGFGWATAAGNAMLWAAGKANSLRAAIDALHSRSITVTTRFNNITENSVINKVYNQITRGGKVPVGATGGIVNRPTYALIGEAGPEAVIPLDHTSGNRPLPKGMGGGGDIYIDARGALDPVAVGREVQKALLALKRTNGGASLGLT